jgi:hypothetical protein
MPPRLDTYLTNVVRLSASERSKLLAGSPITKFLRTDANKEVAVFGAIWIHAPSHRYVEAVKDIDNFESAESFKITKKISSPPKLETTSRNCI